MLLPSCPSTFNMVQCAICNKTAYPLESVKALDKTYHKGCFKCDVCKMTLNLKNFKGLEGKIYCNTHTPVARSSASGDSVAVKTALNAPKKKAESIGVAQKGTAKFASDAPVVKSSDPAPTAIDQSVEAEARGEHVSYDNVHHAQAAHDDDDGGHYHEDEHEHEHEQEQGGHDAHEAHDQEEQYDEQYQEEQYDEGEGY